MPKCLKWILAVLGALTVLGAAAWAAVNYWSELERLFCCKQKTVRITQSEPDDEPD